MSLVLCLALQVEVHTHMSVVWSCCDVSPLLAGFELNGNTREFLQHREHNLPISAQKSSNNSKAKDSALFEMYRYGVT